MGRADSYFDGGVLGFIGIQIGTWLLTVLTLGIALPWALTWRERWITSHTVIEGRRLRFTGSGAGLFWRWIKLLLIIITLGIYSFWAWIYVKRWMVEHTEFVDMPGATAQPAIGPAQIPAQPGVPRRQCRPQLVRRVREELGAKVPGRNTTG
jgi:uncharacterized membrane protein YjgN (DUF898 family)